MNKTKFSCERDGLCIRGHMWRSHEGILPAVILSHGFLANEKMCHGYARLFAEMGYAAFTFDFCGGGLMSRSDGKSVDMTVLTEKADLEAVLAFVKERPDVDENHISLLGCSQGGLVSALVAGDHPGLENLILLYPALCIPDDARAGKMMMFQFDPEHMPEILGRFPMKIGRAYAEAVMDMDFKEIVGRYRGRTVFLHGTADEIVNIRYAREAKECIADCRYYEIEGGGHMFKKEHDEEAMRILEKEMQRSI